MNEEPNARITRRCDSITALVVQLEAAAKLGFDDVTVTTIRQDADHDAGKVACTYYVLDLAENVVMRPMSVAS